MSLRVAINGFGRIGRLFSVLVMVIQILKLLQSMTLPMHTPFRICLNMTLFMESSEVL